MPAIAKAKDENLPACSRIRTPHTELSNMFLIEPERGCSRGCTYCVMRRSTNGGMRWSSPEQVHALIPDDARRVGLVGAAVSDHPGCPRSCAASSTRAARWASPACAPIGSTTSSSACSKRGGYRTLTTAADGASERMRDRIQRKTKERTCCGRRSCARRTG